MSCPFGPEELTKLQAFVGFCSTNPQVINIPQLSFFKDFIEKLGGTVPAGEFRIPTFESASKAETKAPKPAESKAEATPATGESDVESDVELDMTGVIEGDSDTPQAMGDASKEPTEEEMDEASEIRAKAASAYSEQNYQETIDLYTKAIELNPHNALFHAKRGQAYLKLQKPNACIRDCDRALELNCDNAAAYKFRGRANRLLGNWELAAKDLRQAVKLDFDEEADEWLKEVTPNAKKLEQHKVKQERKRAERELQKKQERVRQAQEANRKAEQEQKQQQSQQPPPHGRPNAPGGAGMPNLANLFGNLDQAELLSAFSDPEVSAAMQDIMSNPANISKYQSNPKIMNLITKIGSAMGGAGGGGGGGGFPGAGGGAGAFPGAGFTTGAAPNAGATPPKKPDFSDDGLD